LAAPVIAGLVVAIPVGVALASAIPPRALLGLLGLFVMGFALYGLAQAWRAGRAPEGATDGATDGAADGANAFDAPGSPLGDTLSFAVGGAQASAAETFLISAPNLNSYRRFRAGSYAPIAATWGLDNRGAAVRVPSTCGPSARLENRIAGADANPYLVAAAVIAGALSGIARRQRPGPPSIDDCGEGPSFARNMEEALDVFARSEFVADWLGEEFRRVFSAIKAQEIDKIGARVSDVEHELYLRVV
ncbi:MAG: hypothetical protein AAGF45_07360, partial [Pseudomonadota bacterium]